MKISSFYLFCALLFALVVAHPVRASHDAPSYDRVNTLSRYRSAIADLDRRYNQELEQLKATRSQALAQLSRNPMNHQAASQYYQLNNRINQRANQLYMHFTNLKRQVRMQFDRVASPEELRILQQEDYIHMMKMQMMMRAMQNASENQSRAIQENKRRQMRDIRRRTPRYQ